MTKVIFENEALKYLNDKIDRLNKKLNKVEDLLFKWGRKYMEMEDLKEQNK